MKRFLNKESLVIGTLITSMLCFFLPWFYFCRDIDDGSGKYYLLNTPLILLFFVAIICTYIKEYLISAISSSLIIAYQLYLFLTYPVIIYADKIDILTSLSVTHYGFYLTLLTLVIATSCNFKFYFSSKHQKLS
ncbi:MAG: hypothetical protein RSB66_08305 [Clostridium sp.]